MIDPNELNVKASENVERQIGRLLIENIRMATEIALIKELETATAEAPKPEEPANP